MGCDIHMYAEKYNKTTGVWEKLGNVFLVDYYVDTAVEYMKQHLGLTDSESRQLLRDYFRGKEPTSKIETYVFKKFFKGLFSSNPEEIWKNKTHLPIPKTDQPYTGRNYLLFGALGGVRSDSEWIAGIDRGLPDDVSDEVCALSDEFGIDGHSHNYIYLYEILSSHYYHMTDLDLNELGFTHFFKEVIPTLMELTDNPRDIRLVFWFDN